MMDLNKMINDSLVSMKEEGFVENVVKKELQKTIESVVHDSLRDWSDFGKGLKKQVEEQLQINLKNLDLPSYNQLIAATIKDHLNAVVHEQGVNRMKEQLDNILLTGKEEYKLSELVKEMVREVEDLDEIGYEEYHTMSMIIERSYGLTFIYLDPEEDKEKYDCKYRITVDPDDQTINSIQIRESRYSSTKEFKEFDTKTILGGFYGLEETLFKMYARKSKLIIDESACQLEITNPEYE